MSPIKILILTANPSNTGVDPLGLDAEVRTIEGALVRSKHRDRFQLVSIILTEPVTKVATLVAKV